MREVKNTDSMEEEIENRRVVDRFDVIFRPIVSGTFTYCSFSFNGSSRR